MLLVVFGDVAVVVVGGNVVVCECASVGVGVGVGVGAGFRGVGAAVAVSDIGSVLMVAATKRGHIRDLAPLRKARMQCS